MNQAPILTQPRPDPYTVNVLRSQFHVQIDRMTERYHMQLDTWLDGL